MYGCTGSSVTIELYVRVTSVTGAGLVSNRICLRTVSVEFHHIYQCFCRHGAVLRNPNPAHLKKCQSSVLCDLQIKMCTLHQDLVLFERL